MKKAIVEKGYVMQVKEDKEYNPKGYTNYYSFTKSKEEFLENEKDLYFVKPEDIKLLSEVDLYKICSCKPNGDINILIDFRKKIGKPNSYDRYATIKDIKNLLDKNYVVAVKGIGEIDNIEDIK